MVGALCAQSQPVFPDLGTLLPRVAQHQKDIESLLNQYTYTDQTTVYMLDNNGAVRDQHTDTYYVTPTPYQVFTLHISHDGKPVSERELAKQEKETGKKILENERKAQKNVSVGRQGSLTFAGIILKSRFTLLRWEYRNGTEAVVCAFEPKSLPQRQGSFEDRVAGDMKGTMWISPVDAEILRMEFTSVSPLSIGLGLLGKVKSFEGFVEQRKVHEEIWLPSRQEFVAQGREWIKGFRIRQVSEFTNYLKATTNVFQQIHSPGVVRP